MPSFAEQLREILNAEPSRRNRLAMVDELKELTPLLREETVLEEVNEQGDAVTAAENLGLPVGAVYSLLKRNRARKFRKPRKRVTRTE